MDSELEPNLFVLDQAGIAFRGKVPAYVATQVIDRYWKDETGWWYLTEERASPKELSTWIASRDWFDEAYILPPGSTFWLNVNSHYVYYIKKVPLEDPNWQAVPEDEMWLIERDDAGVHITRYMLTEGEESVKGDSNSPILLEWYKAQALRIYKERIKKSSPDAEQQHILRLSIANEVTPWDADEPDLIALLIAEHWLLNEPLSAPANLPAHRAAETIGDLFLQRVYLVLVSTLEMAQEDALR
ncbi:MAG: hypothetical protein H0U76_22105 [Ktedonobacteraceae bacterium]|nr:hypothetical protein [Ktedonobacteraceae bacterium]